ncbi:hypothetical protein SynA1524_01449 [Synechococcus sp. A15-24]|nr:hypothetical protein SynA1524_01449 [Synechococcus sp. A15-24]
MAAWNPEWSANCSLRFLQSISARQESVRQNRSDGPIKLTLFGVRSVFAVVLERDVRWTTGCSPASSRGKPVFPRQWQTRLGIDILRMSDCGKAVRNIGEAVD